MTSPTPDGRERRVMHSNQTFWSRHIGIHFEVLPDAGFPTRVTCDECGYCTPASPTESAEHIRKQEGRKE